MIEILKNIILTAFNKKNLMTEFDIKAADWDKNPAHLKISEAVTDKIRQYIPLNKDMTALEYGAGTGITSLILKDYLKEIILMDNSTEMVKVMNEKIKSAKIKNINALDFDLEHTDYKEGKFDLIIAQMVLHHIVDYENIIDRLLSLLNPGGSLAIADLYKEDGSFHGKGFNGHNGFDPAQLSKLIIGKGFLNTDYHHCFVIKKMTSDTEEKSFDIFLLTATKSAY